MTRIARAIVLTGVSLAFACGSRDDRPVIRFLEAPDAGGGWREIISRFEAAHPDIDVELVEGPASTNAREEMYTVAFLVGDTTYDLVYMDVAWVPKLAARGWLRPLDDRFTEIERRAFLPGDLLGSMFDERIYRVPMQADSGMLFYRTDLVERPPDTFDDLVMAAREAQRPPDRWGFVFQGLQYEGLVCSFLEILWGHGGDVMDAEGRVTLDSPEAVRALRWMVETIGTIAPEGVTTYQEEEARHAFQEGRAVFMRNWPYAWTKVQEPASPVRDRVGIVPMVHVPGQESAATLGGWGFGISATARDPDAAWTFVAFATQAEQQKILHFRNGRIPTRRALFEDPEVLERSPYYGALYQILLTARPRPIHPRYAEISDAIQAHVSAALVRQETPEEALRLAAEQLRTIIGR